MGVSGDEVAVAGGDVADRDVVDPHPASRAITQYNATMKDLYRMVGLTWAGTLAFRSPCTPACDIPALPWLCLCIG
jgi:hypothetical protein